MTSGMKRVLAQRFLRLATSGSLRQNTCPGGLSRTWHTQRSESVSATSHLHQTLLRTQRSTLTRTGAVRSTNLRWIPCSPWLPNVTKHAEHLVGQASTQKIPILSRGLLFGSRSTSQRQMWLVRTHLDVLGS